MGQMSLTMFLLLKIFFVLIPNRNFYYGTVFPLNTYDVFLYAFMFVQCFSLHHPSWSSKDEPFTDTCRAVTIKLLKPFLFLSLHTFPRFSGLNLVIYQQVEIKKHFLNHIFLGPDMFISLLYLSFIRTLYLIVILSLFILSFYDELRWLFHKSMSYLTWKSEISICFHQILSF